MVGGLARLKKQAQQLGVYDSIFTATDKQLEPAFRKKFADKLKNGVRGFGYWCWKPQVIWQQLEQMQAGEVLQYSDAGCHLNAAGIGRLNDYFELANSSGSGILAFQAIPPQKPLMYDGRKLRAIVEREWSKGDLLDWFGVRNVQDVVETPQYAGGIIFIKKCAESSEIIRCWMDLYHKDFSLADDSASKSPNLPGFVEHRHDQSIFSILCKLNRVATVSVCEFWYPRKDNVDQPDWEALATFPIHARRDKKGKGMSRYLARLKYLVTGTI